MDPSSHNQSLPRSNDDDLNLKRYFGLFLSNWYWFALALFAAGMLAYGINTYSERVYTVRASLLIKDDQSSDMTGLDKIMPGGDLFRSQQNLQNEIGILRSFSLNRRVMEELGDFHTTIVMVGRRGIAEHRHYKTAPFVILYDSLSAQRAGVPVTLRIRSDDTYSLEINGNSLSRPEYTFGERFSEAGFSFVIEKRNPENFIFNPEMSNRFTFWFNRSESLANAYRGRLNIQPINEESSLLNLSVTGSVPSQEADYLNKLMEVYIRQGLEYKNQTAEKTLEFIDEQLSLIADSLTLAEDRLESFRLSNRLIDLSSEGASIKNRLETYTGERITMSLKKQYYEYLAGYLENGNPMGEIVSPSVMGVDDQVLIGLVDQLILLQDQKNQLSYNYKDNQSVIRHIDEHVENTRLALSENVRNNIENIDNTLKNIDLRIEDVEHELNRLPGTEKRLINIQRKFDLNNTVYTYMLEKRSEAGIARASNVSGNRIIDRAEPFNVSLVSPRTRRNYMLALILGLIIPGLYIFLVDQFHNKIIDRKDIEQGTTVPVIGFIGHNASKSEFPVVEKPGSSLSESFRSVRTNLKYYLNGEKKGVISVTSTISGEGKTFVSLNLAAVLSMLGKKTLLVGLDLRKPRLNRLLDTSGGEGLSSFLIGEADFEDIVCKTGVENLFFVPSGAIPPNPSELIESERMKIFIEMARKEYDYVVIDTPPVGVVSDALLLGGFADVNIFVIRQKFSFKSTLELIQNISDKDELKNLTIAVNDIHISGYYGYGLRYGYGFYQGYGYNYGYGQYGSYGKGDYIKYYSED
jgi:capsular exopolysaccharide synthesis family protein